MKIICIYKITNLVNNKIYIGSTSNYKERKYEHTSKLKRNIHINCHLQRSYNKHGKDNFKFEILEECKVEELLLKEKYYSDLYNSFKRGVGYNICPIMIGKNVKLAEETRIKMSKRMKEDFKTGKRSKNRMSELNAKKVYLYKDNILIKEYKSGAELAKEFKTTRFIVNQCIKRSKGEIINNKKSKFKGYKIIN